MEKTIDEKCYLYGSCKCQTAGCVIRPDNGCPVYRYFKGIIVKDYETRLKADVVAILTEIQLEIEELDTNGDEWSDSLDACNDIIQEKIDQLKGK